MPDKNKIIWRNHILFFLFIILFGIYKFSFHEFWKDEWQAWFVATDTTIREMFSILPYEGHPSLWYLILRFANLLSELLIPAVPKEYVIQIVHFLLSIICFYIFFIKFRLNIWIKLGFCISYYMFFEYGIVNRGYVLVILCTFILGVLAHCPLKNYLKYSIVLLLLTQTEVYGLFIAFAFTLYTVLSYLEQKSGKQIKQLVIIVGTLLLGAFIFFITNWSALPENQSAIFSEFTKFRLTDTIKAFQALLVNTFFPGIIPTIYHGISTIGVLLSIAIACGIFFTFNKNKKLLYSYLLFFAAVYLFITFFYIGAPRQWGIHFIFYITFLNVFLVSSDKIKFNKIATGLIILTMIFQGIHGIKIIKREKDEPFSNAIVAGRFIKQNIPKNSPVFAVNNMYCTPVIGYADRKFLSLPYIEYFSYFKWKDKLYIPHIKDFILIKSKMDVNEIYIISYKPFLREKYPGLKLVTAFDKPNIRNENYYLYSY